MRHGTISQHPPRPGDTTLTADLSDILLLIAALAGAILLLDRLLLRPRRSGGEGVPGATTTGATASGAAAPGAVAKEPALVTYSRALFPVLLIVVLIRSFVFEPFRIPSASMMPGLVDGDFIVVSKFTYGLRLPVIHRKFFATWDPQRGDVVVFRSTSGPAKNLIKRLVGLPGDHVVVRDNRVAINGTVVPISADGYYAGGFGFSGSPLEREQLGRADHQIMLAPQLPAADFEGVVPAGHYFFMGDNRNDSEDSRFAAVGFVPEDHLVGHALRIWMNWRLPGWPQPGRIGMVIR